jgi:D-alanine-D-alanine ligase
MSATKKTIALLFGGKSGEHEVSLKSAASVLSALRPEKYDIKLIGITKNGKWYLQDSSQVNRVKAGENLQIIEQNEIFGAPGHGLLLNGISFPVDVVLPIVHGTNLEDGILQGFLETLELAYAGSTVLGSAVSFDKDLVKRLWNHEGIPTIPYLAITHDEFKKSSLEDIWEEIHMLSEAPFFIKPARGGSSVGVSKVHNKEELHTALNLAFTYDEKIIIEQGVKAREIECSVIGNSHPKAFVPGEISATHEFYDYEAKYLDDNGAALLVPAPLSEEIADQIKNLAVKAYKCAEARGLSRVDFFYDEENNKVYINEINTLPGFTKISMFPRMCAAGGLEYPDLLDELIDYAIQEFQRKSNLRYTRN